MDETEDRQDRSGSKALPVAVGGGIAVLVFGVMLAVRTNGPAPVKPPVATPTDKVETPTDKPVDKPVVASATPDAPAAVAAAAPDAAPAAKMSTLTFDVKPADAKVTVNGKPLSGGKIQFQTGDYKVKVEVRAPGYQPHDEEISVAGDSTVAVELKKEVAATKPDTTKTTTPTKTPPPDRTPPVHKPPPKKKIDL